MDENMLITRLQTKSMEVILETLKELLNTVIII